MTDEEIIQVMAKAMAESLRDQESHHYLKPARAAFYVAKDKLAEQVEQARAGAQPEKREA